MEVDIAPITPETTKTLARLYPSDTRCQTGRSSSNGLGELLPRLSAYDGQPRAQVLDSFFAADFIPPYQNTSSSSSSSSRGRTQAPTAADHESYGVKYVRYLHQFSQDQLARLKTDEADDERVFVDKIVADLGASGRGVWDSPAREAVLAYAIVVQARIERSPELLEPWGSRLAEAFWASRLPGSLWRSIHSHLVQSAAAAPDSPLQQPPAPTGPTVRADELEVAVELLFLFSNWSATGVAGSVCGAMGMRATQRVCVAVELFTRYARHTQRRRGSSAAPKSTSPDAGAEPGGAVGRVQRLRVGHKALLLLEVTWRLVVGGEEQALRRIGDSPAEKARSGMGKLGLARDALRQIRESVEKYPLLAPDVLADAERLQPFVHPFDGHLTRVTQLGRFGPIRTQSAAGSPSPLPGLAAGASPSTHMLLVDMLARMDTAAKGPALPQPQPQSPLSGQAARKPRELGLSQPPPRAAREAVDAYVACVRMTRSEREYAEWWHRLIRERGMPLSLTLNAGVNAGPKRGMSSDVTINYADAEADQRRRSVSGQRFEFCGVVEAEDLPGLEMHLDGRDVEIAWPPATAPEPEPLRAGYADLYRALFPLLPALCRALVLTAVNWSPVERELPPRPFLVGVGPPQVSSATCLGVVKYPTPAPTLGPLSASSEDPARASSPTSPLGGSNVKRLLSSSASSPSLPSGNSSTSASDGSARSTASLHSGGSDSSDASVSSATAQQRHAKHAQPHAPAELSARLVTQYAQWQAVGGLLMRVMLGLQANHVLQADYVAQLLMNENLIPAFFWWLGTANLDLCVDLPPPIRAHTFMAAYGTAACSGGEWAPAIRGLYDCMRVLRRLTSHNGLRKGLLYKNKALYFYARLLKLPHASIRQIAAELYRDIMPVVSKKQKLQPACLESIAHVYVNAPPSLADVFWLADFSLDPQIEMHRHVELLRLLHFYHYEAFGLRLPRDPALFPSLVSQVVDPPPPATLRHSHARHSTLLKPLATGKKSTVVTQKSCRQSGAAMGEYSWLLWESDLEDTLNDVYPAPKSTTT
ncbi:hypothetical protein H4218_002165 [Coemansia sp. IMI 209128]|nr:hypothetical protein H4218_002165 [Coemansia sp. IMI 209128]